MMVMVKRWRSSVGDCACGRAPATIAIFIGSLAQSKLDICEQCADELIDRLTESRDEALAQASRRRVG